MPTSITFLLPSPAAGPTGGYKVVYEYANRLVADGYQVNVVYAGSIFWSKKSLYYKLTNCVRYVQKLWQGYSSRSWFPLDERVKEVFAWSLCYRHVPQSDIYVATSPHTAEYLKNYPIPAERKYYLLQGYENWGIYNDAKLRQTYHYPLQKIAISTWLKKLITEEEKEPCILIPNGFDFDYFKMTIPVHLKNKFSITMLYHTTERKGCRYGLEALEMVKKMHPQLTVSLFGAPEQPLGLPDWIHYYRCPDKETHNRIYNESAIYLAPSVIEGWGLTVGEAMICGAAVVCTDNDGFREMATDGETALFAPVCNAEALAKHIIRLIEDDELRCRLASNGHIAIQRFNWETSYQKLLQVFNLQ